LVWDLGRKTAQFFKRPIDLAVRLCALRQVQLQRQTRQTAVGPPRQRRHYFQILIELLHRRQGRSGLMLPLRLQKQLWLIQKPLANCRRRSAPGGIQLSRFPAAQPVTGKPLRHAPAVVRTGPGHRNQELHRHVRRDGAVAHLLLHTAGKQLDQSHPSRHPARAAIETARQFLKAIAEALLQFHQQPAFFQSRFVVARTHRPIQKQSLHFAQRPDHRLHRIPTQLLESRGPLIAVDHQVSIRLPGCDHYDRSLLTAGRQRCQQTPMPLRPAYAEVLKTPLKLVKFQPHHSHPLDSYTLHQVASGIARRNRVVSPHPPWNQYDMASSGIARSAPVVRP
jgi:hypothetical protein